MKVSKVVCTVGSGVGGTLGAALVVGLAAGVLVALYWLTKMIVVKWILAAVLILVVTALVVAVWWGTTKWLYRHCQDYWSKK